ncbi:MAG TPA: hypothetical protein VHA52_09595, partial [Candidatus Babeliaceae bacterium]|nr:hypothetical protein [Candidatus Babeliaceae bacterium]
MRDADSVKIEQHARVNPGIFHARYYHLKELKRCIQEIVGQYFTSLDGNKVLVDYGCGSMPYKEYFVPYVTRYIGADIEENTAADVKIID